MKTAQFLGLTVVGIQNLMYIPHVYINPIAACSNEYINSTTVALELFTCRHSNTDTKHVIDSCVLPSIEYSIVLMPSAWWKGERRVGWRGCASCDQVTERKDKLTLSCKFAAIRARVLDTKYSSLSVINEWFARVCMRLYTSLMVACLKITYARRLNNTFFCD